ncbi:MAG TPA: methyl-accepting chemotaxis protein [Usitatibacter sp.]|nr:methyl-accepting chemotaxis protein [Usitatibacter sp.]
MFLRNVSIGTRLAAGFGTVLAVMLVASVAATYLGSRSRDQFAAIVEKASAKERLAGEIKAVALEQSAVMRNIGLHADIKGMQADEDKARALGRTFHAQLQKLGEMAETPVEQEIIRKLLGLESEVEEPFKQALGLSTSFRTEEAAAVLLKELDPNVQRRLAELNRLMEAQAKAYGEAVEAAIVMGDRVSVTVYVLQGAVLLMALLLAWTTTRSITRPLGEAVAVARRVAAGDLTSQIESQGADEAAKLLGALREMNGGLGSMVAQIRQGAESIAVGAEQVASGNQQLSTRTEEHASALEETASTLEEFTTTVRQNAEHASQANALAGEASVTAQRGGEVVSRVVSTMQEVSTSSKRISDIIAVIDGISFQTNILALNAAVEAARAGEQGRGFAVVASEVRSLAQRSAASAKEIRGLIESSVNRVEAGSKLVEQAGKTMDELVVSVKKVAEIMTEIAGASQEQSSGIEQINRAITQMDQVVQMNASLVEEATAAATSMAQQATGLAKAVAQFRIHASAEAVAHEASSVPPSPRPLASNKKGSAILAHKRQALLAGAE